MLHDTTLSDFARDLAARASTPGGGSAAAYVGALGASLGAMAARFTVGRKGFEQHEAALAGEIERLDALRCEALELLEADVQAYGQVRAAYSLPRADDESTAVRRAAIQAALLAAMDPPLRTCRLAVQGLRVLESLGEHVNPNLASDVAVGAHCLGAAFRAAWVNVLVNLSGLRDEERHRRVKAEGEELSAVVERLERKISGDIVTSMMA